MLMKYGNQPPTPQSVLPPLTKHGKRDMDLPRKSLRGAYAHDGGLSGRSCPAKAELKVWTKSHKPRAVRGATRLTGSAPGCDPAGGPARTGPTVIAALHTPIEHARTTMHGCAKDSCVLAGSNTQGGLADLSSWIEPDRDVRPKQQHEYPSATPLRRTSSANSPRASRLAWSVGAAQRTPTSPGRPWSPSRRQRTWR